MKMVLTVGWNSTGKYLATGSSDHTVKMWECDAGGNLTERSVLRGHSGEVERLAWHPKNKDVIGTVSSDKTVKLWDVRAPSKPTASFPTPGRNINCSWSMDGNYFASGHTGGSSREEGLMVVDLRTKKATRHVRFKYEVNQMAWDKHGFLWLTTCVRTAAGDDGALEAMELTDAGMTRRRRLHAHTTNATALSFNLDGSLFASGGGDGIVNLFDADELSVLRSFDRTEWTIKGLSFSHDSKFLAIGSEDTFLEIASVASGRRVRAVRMVDSANSVAWHPTKHILAYASDDRKCTLDQKGSVHLLTV